MFLLESPAGGEESLIFSASDLVTASECGYRTLRVLDEKLARASKPNFPQDAMLARAAELGDAYEAKVLAELVSEHGFWDPVTGRGVKIVDRVRDADGLPTPPSWASLEAKREETLAALRGGADVVFQATFFDGSLVGFADFLVKQEDGSYAVWDTKLARHAKVSALLQLAAYGDQLGKYGIPVWPVTTLVLGDRSHSDHPMADLLPVFREHRNNFLALTQAHRSAPNRVTWEQTGITHCGRCNYCAEQIVLHHDLLLVNGMTGSQRRKLMAQGIITIDQLARLPEANANGPLVRLRDQARMQLHLDKPDGTSVYVKDGSAHTVSFKVLPGSISQLPAPCDGDIFFDFEGDPLWQDPLTQKWGIEYLFGTVEAPVPGSAPGTKEVFKPLWAHSRSEERQALVDFIAYVQARRTQFPQMHVYHYAPYEKSALRNLSVFHGVGEDAIDDWLRTGLLVDLLDTVRHSLRISEASYSIKKLEPLYMGTNLRAGDVKDAGASVVAYAQYCAARDAAVTGDCAMAAEANKILASISDYNEYDCLSTLRLRDWLLSVGAAIVAPERAESTGALEDATPGTPAYEPSPEEQRLHDYLESLAAEKGHEFTADETAIALVSAAAGYHRREDKQFWWAHFDRLEKGPTAWKEERNMLVIDSVEILDDWAKATPRARTESRTLRLTGQATEGSDFRAGTSWFGMYEAPLPEGLNEDTQAQPLRAGLFNMTVMEDAGDPSAPELTTLVVQEKSTQKVPSHTQLPSALTPDKPVPTKSIREALAALANEVGGMLPSLPKHPGVEILRRARPRLFGGGALPCVEQGPHPTDYIGPITDALRQLDYSYLAVQGPPGTGKTHVGSHAIAALVAEGWKIGVVGQSHAVVENMLRAAIEKAGVDPSKVGKKLAAAHDVPWEITDEKQFAKLLTSEDGALIGGTAWTMTGANVPAGSLDLLVIDEAGQYSLANTLAVSACTKRLLLLGDPQQLPQVTQGSHPAPVDESALGWLSEGKATLEKHLGYFLADSWRMHPQLCAAVSRLSYDGKLSSAPAAQLRHLEGKPAGVETVLVQHNASALGENTQSSPEEAAEVVAQIQSHLGFTWTPGEGLPSRPLEQKDFLVVAAYNAQVHLVRSVLDAASLSGVRVGTVDKFQGQEAAVVLLTLACADPTAAPRGMEFLLNRNRINVAISRGQWRAIIIRSPQLSNFMPSRPAAMSELGAFIGLCERGQQANTVIAATMA
ncbi:TM0106 family RecB-like putative nuclease [Arthrobacter cryoconiti]|uniref:TM0106 family RecB-like putative nuclease n=1 Tax=Arthrobacter cryoconiti TaxID=748907 RepID=A0ABV8QY73_9MICC|nr:bifunctional RecB family nuclease/DEAD/DEAH box helicase [Arthrobacter cryoconiti]MCC9067301.1 TM0106 family RecB-like putative nuclease [Arthrobacter cryoconiti]